MDRWEGASLAALGGLVACAAADLMRAGCFERTLDFLVACGVLAVALRALWWPSALEPWTQKARK